MGLSPIFVRLADVGPFTSAFWRVSLALPALFAWMRFSERGEAAAAPLFARDLLCGLAFTGDLLFWHLSICHTSVANATFFATTAPIWVVAFGWLLFRDTARRRMLVGLALCIAGGAALLAQSLQLRSGGAIGDVDGLATGVFFGLYFLAVQAARRGAGAARVTFESTVITAAALFVVAAGVERRLAPQTLRASLALLAWRGSATPAARGCSRSRSAACRRPSPRWSFSSRRSRRRLSPGPSSASRSAAFRRSGAC